MHIFAIEVCQIHLNTAARDTNDQQNDLTYTRNLTANIIINAASKYLVKVPHFQLGTAINFTIL
jgi:hypothetical protein